MNIENYSPEELFSEQFSIEYEDEIDAIWWEIIRLKLHILFLKKLTTFPFDVFNLKSPTENFWDFVIGTFYDMSILIIWRIVIDNDTGTLTIKQLKNKIKQNINNDELRTQFVNSLRTIKFEKEIESIENKIKVIRNNYIAHFNKDRNLESKKAITDEVKITLLELETVSNAIEKLFDLLCFSFKKSTLPVGYLIPDSENDLDKILDQLVRNSTILNMPEEQPKLWEHYKSYFNEFKINIINEYRVKFDLQKV